MIRPIAAVEKIASDLGYLLSLPIPPVTLWERHHADQEANAVAVSAVPFAGVERWELVKARPSLAALVVPHCHTVMSKMFVFDTWLQCYDHFDHGGNLLFTLDNDTGDAVFAYIDYSYAMTHSWKQCGFNGDFVAPLYTPQAQLSAGDVIEAVESIEGVSNALIGHVVERVPARFLSRADARLIVDGLIYRRDHLRVMVSTQHTGVF